MIDLTTHYVLSITSSTIIGTAAVIMAFIHMPAHAEWAKISKARWVLVATFAILCASGYFKVSDEDPTLLSLTTLCVASYQALLFTYTCSVLISPSRVSNKRYLSTFGFITLFAALLGLFKAFSSNTFSVIWPLALAAYCVQLCILTQSFCNLSRQSQAHLEHYYDEDVDHYLRPIRRLFFSALTVGVLAFVVSLLPLGNLAYNFFVLFYTAYYLWVAIALINYHVIGHFILQADMNIGDDHAKKLEDVSYSKQVSSVPNLKARLQEWINNREFLTNDTNTEDIAVSLGVTRQQLAAYCKNVYHMSFRSWRMALRLRYAQELLHHEENLKLSQLYERAGFNDRSNFHNEFRKTFGMSPKEYREKYGPGNNHG